MQFPEKQKYIQTLYSNISDWLFNYRVFLYKIKNIK